MITYLTYLLIVSVLATSMMTLFSFLLSNKKDRQFREPEILNKLISRSSTTKVSIKRKNVAGWFIHFGIGIVFTVIFLYLYNLEILSLDLLSILIFGISAGISGIIGWQFMFYLNSNPPDIALKSFYLQLIVAHLVFSIFLIGGFYIFN